MAGPHETRCSPFVDKELRSSLSQLDDAENHCRIILFPRRDADIAVLLDLQSRPGHPEAEHQRADLMSCASKYRNQLLNRALNRHPTRVVRPDRAVEYAVGLNAEGRPPMALSAAVSPPSGATKPPVTAEALVPELRSVASTLVGILSNSLDDRHSTAAPPQMQPHTNSELR